MTDGDDHADPRREDELECHLGPAELLAPSGRQEFVDHSQADGAALTLSNNPQGLRPPTHSGTADARIEDWDSREVFEYPKILSVVT